jgi:hypothetical protein
MDAHQIQAELGPPAAGETTEEAQLRACLTEVLAGHSDVETIRICQTLIVLMRDQLSTQVAHVRRAAAAAAYSSGDGLTIDDIAAGSGQSVTTVRRLLSEAKGAAASKSRRRLTARVEA